MSTIQTITGLCADPEDAAREERIKRFGESMLAAARPSDAMLFWEMMRAEIARRSPAQIQKMERERSL